MSQIERIIVIIIFRPSNCCSKLKLPHHCHLPRCRVHATLFPTLPIAALPPAALTSTVKPLATLMSKMMPSAATPFVRAQLNRNGGSTNAKEAGPAARQSITTLSPLLKLAVTAESTRSDSIAHRALPGVPFPARRTSSPSMSPQTAIHPVDGHRSKKISNDSSTTELY